MGDQHRHPRRRIRTERRSVTAEVRRGSQMLALETLPPAKSPSGAGVTMAAALARLGLRSVKQVRVQFCPFEKNVESTRYEGQRCGREGARLPPAGL